MKSMSISKKILVVIIVTACGAALSVDTATAQAEANLAEIAIMGVKQHRQNDSLHDEGGGYAFGFNFDFTPLGKDNRHHQLHLGLFGGGERSGPDGETISETEAHFGYALTSGNRRGLRATLSGGLAYSYMAVGECEGTASYGWFVGLQTGLVLTSELVLVGDVRYSQVSSDEVDEGPCSGGGLNIGAGLACLWF